MTGGHFFSVLWYGVGSACIACSCGNQLIVTLKLKAGKNDNTCKCGVEYTMVQRVEVVEK